MKRFFGSILILCAIIFAPSLCLADGYANAFAFMNVYYNGLHQIKQSTSTDAFDKYCYTESFVNQDDESSVYLISGSLHLAESTHEIRQAEWLYIDVDGNSKTNVQYSYRCLALFAALESSKSSSTGDSIYQNMSEIFNISDYMDQFLGMTKNITAQMSNLKSDDDKILVYSGNYQYYIQSSYNADQDAMLIYIIAEK